MASDEERMRTAIVENRLVLPLSTTMRGRVMELPFPIMPQGIMWPVGSPGAAQQRQGTTMALVTWNGQGPPPPPPTPAFEDGMAVVEFLDQQDRRLSADATNTVVGVVVEEPSATRMETEEAATEEQVEEDDEDEDMDLVDDAPSPQTTAIVVRNTDTSIVVHNPEQWHYHDVAGFRVGVKYRKRNGPNHSAKKIDFTVERLNFPNAGVAKSYPQLVEMLFRDASSVKLHDVFCAEVLGMLGCQTCKTNLTSHRKHSCFVGKSKRNIIKELCQRQSCTLKDVLGEMNRGAVLDPAMATLPPPPPPLLLEGPTTPGKKRASRKTTAEETAAAEGADVRDGANADDTYEDRMTPAAKRAKKKAADGTVLALAASTPRPMPLVLDWRSEPDELLRALKRCYGHIAFKQDAEGNVWQRNVVEAVLNGKDVVVGRRTGDGKSLPYQLVPLIEALRVTAARRALSESGGGTTSEAAVPNYKMAVVISPLVSLMQDQVAKLNSTMERLFTKEELVEELGLPEGAPVAALLGQGQPDSSVEGLVRAGNVRLAYISEKKLFANPASQTTPPLVAALQALARQGKLALVAVDEAHVVEEWVDSNFRVDYKSLGLLRRDLIDVPFMALSAVPTTSSWIKIKQRICIGIGHSRGVFETHSSIYRGDNLRLFAMTKYSFKECFRAIRDAMYKELEKNGAVEPTIIYMHSVKESEKVKENLDKYLNEDDAYSSERDVKIGVGVYHGEVPFREKFTIARGCDVDEDQTSYNYLKHQHSIKQGKKREIALEEFMEGKVQIMVATDAFGMGVDHSCIRRIIFWGVPQTIEKFYNQLGRAGRDGNDADVFLMCNAQDFNAHEAKVIYDNFPNMVTSLTSLRALRRYYFNSSECRWLPLLRYWNELPSAALVDDAQQPDAFLPCGKCDNCMRPKRAAPLDLSKGVILALLLVDIAGQTPKWGNGKGNAAAKTAKIGDMLKLLTKDGNANEADKLRSQLKRTSSSFWANKERVKQFVEYVPDVNKAELLKKESNKVEVMTPDGKKFVSMTTFSLQPKGEQVLAQYRSPLGEKFELFLPPPLFYLEHGEDGDDEGGDGECGECEPEPEEEEEVVEEEEFAEGQQYLEKANGETVYVPLVILDEKIHRTADGKGVTSEYYVAWKNYATEERGCLFQLERGCLALRCKCKPGECKTWEHAETEYTEDVLWREHEVVAEWEALKARPPEERSAAQNEAFERIRAARAKAEAAIAEEAERAARQAAEEAERRNRDAQLAIDALPFGVHFALKATNGALDVATIAEDDNGRRFLRDLASAESARSLREDVLAPSRYNAIKEKVRVPVKEKQTALVYHVTMGEVNGDWKIVKYDGPHRRNETKLFRELGAANLVELHIEDLKDEHDGELPHDHAVQMRCFKLESLSKRLTEQPIEICGRSFTYLLHKIEHQNDEAKLMLVAVGDSVIMAGGGGASSSSVSAADDGDVSPLSSSLSSSSSSSSSPSPPDGNGARQPPQQQHWSCAGGCILSKPWKTASEAREMLADFGTLEPAKMAKRLGLALSPSIPFFAEYVFLVKDDCTAATRVEDLEAPPEGAIQFILWDEISVNGHVQEDGFGRISIDLVENMPSINNGRIVCEADAFTGAPFALQGRVWANGNLAKGVWAVDPFLPKRTVLIGKSKQLKLAARPSCEAAFHGRSTFEVLRTYDKPNRARTGAYNLFLLSHAVGDKNRAEFDRMILDLQDKLRQEVSDLSKKSSSIASAERKAKIEATLNAVGAKRNGDVSPSAMIEAGFDPLTEPYLQMLIQKLSEDQLKSLKKGKLAFPSAAGPVAGGRPSDGSPLSVGIPDWTQTLEYNEVCAVQHGEMIRRPASLKAGEPYPAIAYRDPGMSAGDVRKVHLAESEALSAVIREFAERGGDASRINVVFLSTKGDPRYGYRSMADMLAGGDYDGDEFQIIVWQDLVKLFEHESKPYDKDDVLPELEPTSKGGGGKKGGGKGKGGGAKYGKGGKGGKAINSKAAGLVMQAATASVSTAAPASRAPPASSSSSSSTALIVADTAQQEAARQEKARADNKALFNNFAMAYFMGSHMVGSSGIEYLKQAEKGDFLSSPECAHIVRAYNEALDESPPATIQPSYYKRLAERLKTNDYPEWLEDKFLKRKEQQAMRKKATSVGDGEQGATPPPKKKAKTASAAKAEPQLVASTSIMGKLWRIETRLPGNPMVRIDRHLTTETWKRENHDMPQVDNEKYLTKWRDNYNEYARRVVELRGNDADEKELSEHDPFYSLYDELIAEFKGRLFNGYTIDEIVQPPDDLFAEIAALYEVCYTRAKELSYADAAAAASSGAGTSGGGAAEPPPPRMNSALIRFPWRLASEQLCDMKRFRVRTDKLRAQQAQASTLQLL